ncbi:MAG: response regulator transcription factor [Firmicutes bacterium]|nr:response regulator transcription factor [Bacillota bacterium]
MAIIAICDDNEIQLKAAAEAVREYDRTLPEDAVRFSVRTFTSAKQLWFEMADRKIADLFLLDIDMPELSGLELAEKIRKIGPRTLILFLTSHTEYALQGYKVDAFRFIPKDRLKEELPEALGAAARELTKTREYISFSEDGILVRVPLDEILYVQRSLRLLEIHTLHQGILSSRKGIREFYDQLGSDRFLFIDRGTFVGIDHIEKIDHAELTITPTKEILTISRRMQRSVKETLARTWSIH